MVPFPSPSIQLACGDSLSPHRALAVLCTFFAWVPLAKSTRRYRAGNGLVAVLDSRTVSADEGGNSTLKEAVPDPWRSRGEGADVSNTVLQPREEWPDRDAGTSRRDASAAASVCSSASWNAGDDRFFQHGGSLYGGEAPRGGFSFKGRRDWGAVISGAILVLMGVVFFVWPNASLVTLTIMAGAAFLISGVFGFVTSYRLAGGSLLRPWAVTYGILDVLIGLLLVVFPSLFSVVLPWLVGLAFVVFGVFEVASSFTMCRVGATMWAVVLICGIVGVLCGIMLFAAPESILVFMGIYLVVRGAMLMCNGLKKSIRF